MKLLLRDTTYSAGSGSPGGERTPPIAALVPAMLLLLAIVLPFGVLVTQPFVGAFVRWRAHYAPMGVGLDGQRDAVGPQLTSLWGTLRRTKRLEGWRGLYKGWVVSVLMAAVLGLLYTAAFSVAVAHANTPDEIALASRHFVIAAVALAPLYIPAEVILARAVVTPYVLPSSIPGALRVLLTPYERKRPWVLWSPLILPVSLLAASTLALITVVRLLLKLNADGSYDASQGAWRPAVVVGIALASTAWVTPLLVATAKLEVQPNYGPGPDGSPKVATPAEAESLPPSELQHLPRTSLTEDVINLRTDAEPYNGLLDTFRKIKNEEGGRALYRTWFWTALANLFT